MARLYRLIADGSHACLTEWRGVAGVVCRAMHRMLPACALLARTDDFRRQLRTFQDPVKLQGRDAASVQMRAVGQVA